MDRNNLQDLFKSEIGRRIYDSAVLAIERYSMADAIRRGVLIGLSGGADSVMLLLVLLEYRRRGAYFPILAVHINHGIRGDEALRDEEFSKQLSKELGVEFLSVSLDVPKMAKVAGVGIEEAARNARYSEFEKIISGRNDVSTICVAHNATDNVETVLMNIFRGSAKGFEGKDLGFFSSLLFGMIFSIGWTPCVGAFLGSALMLASQQGKVLTGVLMLLLYSLGLGIPFILSALLIDKLRGAFTFIKKHYNIINIICGSLLIIVGILMMSGLMGRYLALLP